MATTTGDGAGQDRMSEPWLGFRTVHEPAAADPARFDPHFFRSLAKLGGPAISSSG
jgi:hypothetical protein